MVNDHCLFIGWDAYSQGDDDVYSWADYWQFEPQVACMRQNLDAWNDMQMMFWGV